MVVRSFWRSAVARCCHNKLLYAGRVGSMVACVPVLAPLCQVQQMSLLPAAQYEEIVLFQVQRPRNSRAVSESSRAFCSAESFITSTSWPGFVSPSGKG